MVVHHQRALPFRRGFVTDGIVFVAARRRNQRQGRHEECPRPNTGHVPTHGGDGGARTRESQPRASCSPEDIPERYFTRIGCSRDPRRFKTTGGFLGKMKAMAGVLSIMIRAR
jgi:hypothetical protein